MSKIKRSVRDWLLRLRRLRSPRPVSVDPYSDEYLFLVQQAKRLSYAQTVSRFRIGNFIFWPFLMVIAALKIIDLKATNVLVASLINERMLMAMSKDKAA